MEQIVLTEKRTHNLRYSFEKEIQFYLQTNTDQTFKAITIDICSFGLGLSFGSSGFPPGGISRFPSTISTNLPR